MPSHSPPTFPTPEPLLVDPPTAARMLSFSKRTLWTRTRSGEIPAVRIGRLVRYSPDDLRRVIERRRVTHPER